MVKKKKKYSLHTPLSHPHIDPHTISCLLNSKFINNLQGLFSISHSRMFVHMRELQALCIWYSITNWT